MVKTKTKVKFRVHSDLAQWAKDWDGSGDKIKLRVPVSSGGKKEFLIAPGDVLVTEDPKVQTALEQWCPPPVTIDGQPWRPRNKLFEKVAANTKTSKELDA